MDPLASSSNTCVYFTAIIRVRYIVTYIVLRGRWCRMRGGTVLSMISSELTVNAVVTTYRLDK